MSEDVPIIPIEKTPEQGKAEELEAKKKAFEENPDKFINVNDIIIAAIRASDGIFAVAAPASENEFCMAQGKIYDVISRVQLQVFLKATAEKSAIEKPSPRIRDIFRKH